MPFIKIALDDAAEQEPVPEGEYELQIIKADDGESKKGNQMTTVMLKVMDPPASCPNPAIIRHWITYPDMDTPADQRNLRLIDIKRFLTVFNIQMTEDGFDSDDLVGSTGRCFVYQEQSENNDEIYNRLRLPRLSKKDEASVSSGRRRRA